MLPGTKTRGTGPQTRRSLTLGVVIVSTLCAGVGAFATSASGAGTASAAPRTNWPQIDFDAAHSRFNPNETVLDRRTVTTLHRVWKLAPEWCAPRLAVVANGLAYADLCDGGPELAAYDAATGQLRWRKPVPGQDWASGPPTIYNGVAYIVTEDVGTLSATNAFNGKPVWQSDLNGALYAQSPVAASGLVIADREAFDAGTGKLRWAVPGNEAHGCGAWRARTVDVTVSSGAAYMRCADGSIETRDVATGALRSVRPSTIDGTTPVVVGGVMYYGSAGRMVARAASTGALRWAAATTAPVGRPAVANGAVYAAIGGGKLQAFDAATGRSKWITAVGSGSPLPSVANGVVYVVAGGRLQALDATTGKVLRSVPSNGVSATVVNGMVYAGDSAFAP
jgi:outer membrane protein assembly factor BamB